VHSLEPALALDFAIARGYSAKGARLIEKAFKGVVVIDEAAQHFAYDGAHGNREWLCSCGGSHFFLSIVEDLESSFFVRQERVHLSLRIEHGIEVVDLNLYSVRDELSLGGQCTSRSSVIRNVITLR